VSVPEMPQKRSIAKLFIIPVAMFGFGYLMVPIYDVFCDITGINGKTGTISAAAAAATQVQEQRIIKVEFTSSVNQNGPWDFGPDVPSMLVHPGQPYSTSFTARNKQGEALISQSVPSVAPSKVAAHFNKTECFCFTEQKFDAFEERAMPLTFIIDPDVPEDVDVVTLSYTLFTKANNNNG
jgi:cytochrome c oxidase assembly protein subunit 11